MKKNWKEFIMPWGKHQGWTMFQIYVNDFDYARWLAENTSQEDVREAARAAVNHKDNFDPFSKY